MFGKSKEKKFWDWFVKYTKNLKVDDRYEIVEEIAEALHKDFPDISFELGIGNKKENMFVLSADGIASNIPIVIKLVEAAPKIKNWKVVAFKQPKDEIGTIGLGDVIIDPKDVQFKYNLGFGKVNIQIYLKKFDPKDQSYFSLIFVILDSLLGELAVITQIGEIKIYQLEEDVKDLMPIKELRKVVLDKITNN